MNKISYGNDVMTMTMDETANIGEQKSPSRTTSTGTVTSPMNSLASEDGDHACFFGVLFEQCVRASFNNTNNNKNRHHRSLVVSPPTNKQKEGTGEEETQYSSSSSSCSGQQQPFILSSSQVNGVCFSPTKESSEAEGVELTAVSSSSLSSPSSSSVDTSTMQLTKWSASDLPLRVFPINKEQAWQEMEDDLCLILAGRLDHLAHFEKLHNDGLVTSNLLRSLAYLSSRPRRKRRNSSVDDDSNKDVDESSSSSSSYSHYYEHVSTVAGFLSNSRSIRQLKLSALGTLMTCLSSAEAAWQTQEAVIEGTLDFLTNRDVSEWEFMEHSEMVLIWELRAMCLRQLEREKERVDRMATTGDTAAIYISGGAKILEAGMNESVPIISQRIDLAGETIKKGLKPDDMPLMVSRDAVVALAYADGVKRASNAALSSTRLAVNTIRDASSMGINIVSSQFEDGNLGDKLLPNHPEGREALKAAGKVGMATLGAAALLGEAVVDATRAVASKTASVTADVVQHKYGTSAGQVIRDAGDTAGNVIRTAGNVAMFESKAIAKSVVKTSGKLRVENEVAKAADSVRFLEEKTAEFVKKKITSSPASPRLRQVAEALAAVPTIAEAPPIIRSTPPTVPKRNSKSGKEKASSGGLPKQRSSLEKSLSSHSRKESDSSSIQSSLLVTSSSSFESGGGGSIPRVEKEKRITSSPDCSTSATSSMKSYSSHSKASSQQRFATRRRCSRKKRTPLTPDTRPPGTKAKGKETRRRSSRITTPSQSSQSSRAVDSPIVIRESQQFETSNLPLMPLDY